MPVWLVWQAGRRERPLIGFLVPVIPFYRTGRSIVARTMLMKNQIINPVSCRGFTLLELMITIVIAAILLTVAVPSFTDLIKTNRTRTQISSVMGVIQAARSEAIKRGQTVSVCPLNQAAPRSCTNSWNNSLSAFFDINNDGRLDANEAVVKVTDGLSGNNVMTWNGPQTRISFDARGATAAGGGTLKLCDADNDNKYARAVIVAFPTGRSRLSRDSNGDGTHEGAAGNLSCP